MPPSPWRYFPATRTGHRWLAVLCLLPIVLQLLGAPFLRGASPAVQAAVSLLFALIWLVALLLAARSAGAKAFRPRWRPLVAYLPLAVLLNLGLSAICLLLAQRLFGSEPSTLIADQPFLRALRPVLEALFGSDSLPAGRLLLFGSLLMLPFLCVGALTEELFFRGILQTTLTHYLGPLPGLILPALIFALLHAPLILAFVPMFALGLLFGHVFRRHNLATAILLHLLHNVIAVPISLLSF